MGIHNRQTLVIAARRTVAVLAFAALTLCGLAPAGVADQIISQKKIASSSSDQATLGWPRWKGYMSFSEPNRFWVSYAGARSSASNLSYTTNAGDTWSTNTIQINSDGYVDYHLSAFGHDDDLYFTWPGSNATQFRRINFPAQSDNDRGPLVSLAQTTYQHRSNVMVEPNGRIWVFTRLADSPSQNVRYQFSDNGGSSWSSGVAFATNLDNVRFGSMPYIDGRPALVVLYLNDNRGFEYYLWNGSSFEAQPDHSIFPENMGMTRGFAHTVVNDTTMHLLFGFDNEFHHLWKHFNNGTGGWNHSVIETSTTTSGMEWSPHVTVRGDELYLFYCKKSNSDLSSSNVYYRTWSQTDQSWTASARVSDPAVGSMNLNPNTCFQVPIEANYIPVFWRAGGGDYDIYFSKILVDPYSGGDQIAPARVTNLSATPGTQDGQIRLSWTAPGDDGYDGIATRYVLKFSTTPVTSLSWGSATTYATPPTPLPGGQVQTFTMTGLTPGQQYYLGIRAFDEKGNTGPVSNSPLAFAFGILPPSPLQSSYDPQAAILSLSCTPVSSYHTLFYQFALDTQLTFPQPQLKQASANSPAVTVEYSDVDSGQDFFWRCSRNRNQSLGHQRLVRSGADVHGRMLYRRPGKCKLRRQRHGQSDRCLRAFSHPLFNIRYAVLL